MALWERHAPCNPGVAGSIRSVPSKNRSSNNEPMLVDILQVRKFSCDFNISRIFDFRIISEQVYVQSVNS